MISRQVSLEKLIGELPEGSPLLTDIGAKFSLVGMSSEAVRRGVFARRTRTLHEHMLVCAHHKARMQRTHHTLI